MTDRVRKLVAGNAALTRLADSHLLGLIEPGHIANAALYLASDDSRMAGAMLTLLETEVRFAHDSALEGEGFEPSVPREGTTLRDCLLIEASHQKTVGSKGDPI
jgi:hypothetical protein